MKIKKMLGCIRISENIRFKSLFVAHRIHNDKVISEGFCAKGLPTDWKYNKEDELKELICDGTCMECMYLEKIDKTGAIYCKA